MAKKFVHLHVHTEYSLLDGLSKIERLISHVKENGMDAVAISDHGVMHGVVEFYKKAKKEEVKPIIGMEAYTTNVNHRERPERGKVQNHHLLLLARDNEGYRNLMKLTSIAHLEGYYYRPRVDKETLTKYSKGLICTSACPQGELGQNLISGDYKQAVETAKWFLDLFGKDYYLEVQNHLYATYAAEAENAEIKEELMKADVMTKKINEGVIKVSRELGIPILATNDAHYVKKEDANAQDALVCVATGKNISDTKRLRFIDSPTYYIKTPEEMAELFPEHPDALENTVKIAKQCDVSLILDKWFFPEYELLEAKNADEELKIMANQGLKEKMKNVTKEEKDRLNYELDIIKQKGYATYFLIVSEMATWAHERGIVTNTRGSTAGSLVAYAIGIVDINPLAYELPFERFLTPWRPSPPDIDFDIADDRREEIINHMAQKYGADRVAQICTFGRMLARAAVRDVARVLGFPYSTGDRISKLIPLGSQGFPMTIDNALRISPDLKNLYDTDNDSKKVIDLAKQVEGNARHVSVHAAGLVIAPREVTEFTPVQLDPEGRKIITQYDMDSLDPNVSPGEAVGLLKFDLLGLRNLSILGSCVRIVKESLGVDVDLQNLPLNNKKTFEMLSKGETMGVFQLSGSGMTRYLKELKPTRVEDLMAMVALYRPGPMARIPEYIERKNSPQKVKYFDTRMKEFLGKSYGLIVYQDDVFSTAINIAGYTWEEADKFRKAVGKKIPAEMEKQKQKFIEGAVKNGLTQDKAEELFALIEPFSGYGFNKAHAASYGMVAYKTAYMKANYPVEFMAALLTAESGDSDKVSLAINECIRMRIKVLPPDINQSDIGFKIVSEKESLDAKAIRFGFSAIKNVGKAAIDAIMEARVKSEFISFVDFISRVDARRVNKKVLESLIKVGSLSSFGTRASLLSSIDEVRLKKAKSSDSDQQGLFSQEEMKKSADNPAFIVRTDISEFSQEELQSLERQLLGFSLSARPMGELLSTLENLATHKIYEISAHHSIGEQVRIAGVVTEVKIVVTRTSGNEMAFVKVEDGTGSLELIVFPSIFKATRNYWVEYKPLLISGKVDSRDENPSLIVQSIEVQDQDIIESSKSSGYVRSAAPEKVFIKIPKGADINVLKRLKGLLVSHQGSHNATIVFEGSKKTIDLSFGITWTKDLANEISQILHKEQKS